LPKLHKGSSSATKLYLSVEIGVFQRQWSKDRIQEFRSSEVQENPEPRTVNGERRTPCMNSRLLCGNVGRSEKRRFSLVLLGRSLMKTEIAIASQGAFDWPLAYEAETVLRQFIVSFIERNRFAKELADRVRVETGTDFYEWVDHFTVGPDAIDKLLNVGLVLEDVDAPRCAKAFYHPRAMMPRALVLPDGSSGGVPRDLSIRVESIIDFIARNNLSAEICGKFGARLRTALVAEESGHRFFALERLAYRGFVEQPVSPKFALATIAVRELWRTRRRDFPDDAAGIAYAFELQDKAIALVGSDVACELFFAEERAYWEFRNLAGRVQKRRQDFLGLGWGNHDHHTFRCSRRFFADLIEFLGRLGFEKRERYYAGAEASWGAQILEHQATGITVFADVDLMPDETAVDFGCRRLPEASRLGTVGLWCGLHGDSFLQAGMHHLEARFDFSLLRDQLAREGINTMKPFSDFPFLRQAFTEGERWAVREQRIEKLLAGGLITKDQALTFKKNGAIGSHLENLQRKGGFKGFNQKSVNVIIEATDPRSVSPL
jgi:hypothetical protein